MTNFISKAIEEFRKISMYRSLPTYQELVEQFLKTKLKECVEGCCVFIKGLEFKEWKNVGINDEVGTAVAEIMLPVIAEGIRKTMEVDNES